MKGCDVHALVMAVLCIDSRLEWLMPLRTG